MSFSVLSWNVKAFCGGIDVKANRVSTLIHSFAPVPDVVAIYEVENSHGAFRFARHFFPNCICFITEGQNNKEILLIVNHAAFDFVTLTQKHKFKIGNPHLRPGALVTLTQDGIHTNILFLHPASFTSADGFGDRFEMYGHAFSLNERIQELAVAAGEPARLIIAGDLNTMGLQFPRPLVSQRILTGQREIVGLAYMADRAHIDGFDEMSLAVKEHDLTFRNRSGRKTGDLDHVLVSSGLQLVNLGNLDDGTPFTVRVEGWQQLAGDARVDFIDNVSDHCALYFSVV